MIQPRENLPVLILRLEKERAEKAKAIDGPTLLGLPIIVNEDMPDLGDIVCASFTRESAAAFFRQIRKRDV